MSAAPCRCSCTEAVVSLIPPISSCMRMRPAAATCCTHAMPHCDARLTRSRSGSTRSLARIRGVGPTRSCCRKRSSSARCGRAAYKITPESAQRSLERVRGVFRHVDERLSNGRRFLVGERFTAADLTFAALAAPALFPVECRAVHPALDAVPASMREEILRLRDTDAGRFALRMFSQERARPREP